MTFEEYQQVPNPEGGRYELFHGELVKVADPLYSHTRAQWQLRRRLERTAGDVGVVKDEMPFRPLPEYEGWRADVAFIFADRWEAIDRKGHLIGAPDLVIEILSPSNSKSAMDERERICLENGAREFWLVDTVHRTVRVATANGRITYTSGQAIPLFFGGSLLVDEIFV
jgi:Uma2 family endonuclease